MLNTLMVALDKENINVFRLVLMNRDCAFFLSCAIRGEGEEQTAGRVSRNGRGNVIYTAEYLHK